ncbi:hypothetical protein GCM10023320_83830 [Pseudonocardia adelaidensis]|uniref:Secreted protein n=1 Tax=Pseudonocardia adelaidensis TaxID=648754 RepID=A0ABP9P9G9_9PSEU
MVYKPLQLAAAACSLPVPPTPVTNSPGRRAALRRRPRIDRQKTFGPNSITEGRRAEVEDRHRYEVAHGYDSRLAERHGRSRRRRRNRCSR